jgi:mono/diheme cytochrome c family protein
MLRNPIVLGGIVVAVIAVVAVVFMARPANSVRDGVFTLEQASIGQDLYPSTCPRCHGSDLYGDGFETPSLIGSEFQRHWADGTLADLFEFVSTNMPKSNPGAFPDQTYLDLIAYILRMNGYDVGRNDLVPDMEALAKIKMEMLN